MVPLPEPDPEFRFSYSSVSKWLWCRQQWRYSYIDRIEPLTIDARPEIGSAVHYALAMAILAGGSDQQLAEYLVLWVNEQLNRYLTLPDDIVEGIRAELLTIAQTARIVAIRAVAALPLTDWETCWIGGEPAVEWTFERDIPGLGTFEGAVDWVARNRQSGLVWLFDHKIRGRIAPALSEDYNIQMATYQHILQEDYDLQMGGSITFQVSSQLPKTPRVNKNGSMSRAEIATDWTTYRAELQRHGLDPDDYVDMQERLVGKEFYEKTPYYRNRQTARAVWEQVFLPAAWEMRSAWLAGVHPQAGANEPAIIRSMSSRTCRGCDFSEVCLAELGGRDVDYLVRTHYRPRQSSAARRGQDNSDEDAEVSATIGSSTVPV